MSQERRRVHFVGRVQGVGFRFTAARLAPGFGVSGFVRNVHDGSVELEAQGDPDRIREFIAAIHGELGSKIYRSEESILPVHPHDSHGKFQIEY